MNSGQEIEENQDKKPTHLNDRLNNIIGWRLKYPYILIVGLAAIVYFQTIFYDYVIFDDQNLLFENPQNSQKLNDISTALTSQYLITPYYRPVVNMTYYFEAQIGGESPLTHHLGNLLIHSLSCCLLYILFRKMKYNESASLIMTLLFTIHPLLTNAVVWIVGRCDLLVGLFGIMTLIFYIKFLEKEKYIYLILQSLALLFAIFSKEISILLPLILVFLFYVFSSMKDATSEKFNFNKLKIKLIHIILLLSWLIPIILFYIIKAQFQAQIENPHFSISNIFVNYRVIFETISKFFLPINIVPLPNFNIFNTVLGLILFTGGFVYIYIKKSVINVRQVFFGLAWFLIFSLPVLFIRVLDEIRLSDYIDCRSYFPIIGICIILLEIIPQKFTTLRNKLNLLIFALLLLILSAFTFLQSSYYKDRVAYREIAHKNNPEIKAGFITDPVEIKKSIDFASQKAKVKDFVGAIDIITNLIKSDSTNSMFFAQRGFYRTKIKDLRRALDDFNNSYRLNQKDLYSLFQCAFLKIQLNDNNGAINDLSKLINIQPKNWRAYYYRAIARQNIKMLHEALDDCNTAINLEPNLTDLYIERGTIFLDLGMKDNACENFNKSYQLGSQYAYDLIRKYCSKNK